MPDQVHCPKWQVAVLRGCKRPVNGVAIQPDGRRIARAGESEDGAALNTRMSC
jgi:hypothetical protein